MNNDVVQPECSSLDAPDDGPQTALAKAFLKTLGIGLGLTITAIPGLTCRLEAAVTSRDDWFAFWGQVLALIPGLPGRYLRKCYYRWTLHSCSLSCDIGFLCVINDRRSEIGQRVYLGSGAGLGYVRIGDGCLIGSRVSIINGGRQHAFGADGRLTPFDRASAPLVCIGEETWIGEGAIVMADVGSRCIVGAGSVVPRQVPDSCLVAGNPARLIRRLGADPEGNNDNDSVRSE